jgi:hypothetical protein
MLDEDKDGGNALLGPAPAAGQGGGAIGHLGSGGGERFLFGGKPASS